MKVAIIGAGFTGLAAGVRLVDEGHRVTIYEAGERVGGLAGGFKNHWDWELEEFYHHIFTSDQEVISLAEKVSWPPKFFQPETDCFIDGNYRRLDSPLSVLGFDRLSFLARVRMGLGLGLLKAIPNGQFLERFSTEKTLPLLIGDEAYEKIWKKLLEAKFGQYIGEVNFAWFWARVAKRSAALGYFEGGFQLLAEKLGEYIEAHGGKIKLKTEVKKVESIEKGTFLVAGKRFDRVIVTAPAPVAEKIVGREVVSWPKINYLWGQTLVLELSESLLPVYWVNILEKNWPFLVAVEHTKMIDKKHYGGNHVLYLGNYLEDGDRRLKMNEKELLRLFKPYLKKINVQFDDGLVISVKKFQQPFAQPVFPINYSKIMPEIETKIKGLYVANMSMVYPWDRGTNYAVFLGNRVAEMVME
jgi:protoporphyrinogen oxidase